MRPFLRGGRAIGCRPLAFGAGLNVRPGDILMVEKGRRPVAHRLVEIARTGSGETILTTQGDRSRSVEAVTPFEVVGKVTHVLWRNGAVVSLEAGFAGRIQRVFGRMSVRHFRLDKRAGGGLGPRARSLFRALLNPVFQGLVEAAARFDRMRRPSAYRAVRAEAWSFLRRWAAEGGGIGTRPSVYALQAVFDHDLAGWIDRTVHEPEWRPLEDQKRRQIAAAIGGLSEYERIAAACQARGIPVIPLKAVSLAYGIYRPDPSVRAFGDIDLLILPETTAAFVACLAELGYRPGRNVFLKPGILAIKKKFELLAPPGSSGMGLDIKLSLVTRRVYGAEADLPTAFAFARASVPSGERPFVRLLDPADEWLYLAQHFVLHHRFGGLKWLIDLDRLARGMRPGDREALVRRAAESGLVRIAATAVRAVEKILGPLPEGWSPLRRAGLGPIAGGWTRLALQPRAMLERRFRPRHGRWLNKIEEIHWEVPFIDGRAARIRAFLRRAFPSPNEMDAYWGTRLGPAYILLWPGHVVVWTVSGLVFLADLGIRSLLAQWTGRT